MKHTITLEITLPDAPTFSPISQWDWPEVLDLPPGGAVDILACSDWEQHEAEIVE